MKTVRIRLTAVTPVHIGDGDDIDQLGYIIENGKLAFYDPRLLSVRFMAEGEARFNELVDAAAKAFQPDQLQRFRAMVSRHLDEIVARRVPISEAASAFLNPKNVEARYAVKSQLKDPRSKLPVIPGSSLKGVIRTAFFHQWLKSDKDKFARALRENDRNDPFSLKIHDDMLKVLKVQDLCLEASNQDCIVIDRLKNVIPGNTASRRDTGRQDPIPQLVELVPSGTRFVGSVAIIEELMERTNPESSKSSSWKPLAQFLEKGIPVCLHEYSSVLKAKEKSMFKLDQLDQLESNSSAPLIRLGRFAGALAKTAAGGDDNYADFRKIGPNSPFKTCQSSVWLTSANQSLGWVKLETIEEDEYQQVIAGATAAGSKMVLDRRGREQRIIVNLRAQEEQKRQVEAAAAQQKLEIEQERTRLAGMSETDRGIYLLKTSSDASVIDSQAARLYIQLGSMEEAAKVSLAAIIKEAFIKLNKWSGSVSEKQKKKVAAIKAILGE